MHSVNNELVKAGHDFAAAISNDTPIIEIAKMVANLATQLDVTTLALREKSREVTAYEATVMNLTAQVMNLEAALSTATESLANAHHVLRVETARSKELEAQVQGLAVENADLKHPGTYLPSKRETPITDAALAEIRAQGVDLAIEHLTKKFEGTGGVGVPVMALEHLASELRKEQGK